MESKSIFNIWHRWSLVSNYYSLGATHGWEFNSQMWLMKWLLVDSGWSTLNAESFWYTWYLHIWSLILEQSCHLSHFLYFLTILPNLGCLCTPEWESFLSFHIFSDSNYVHDCFPFHWSLRILNSKATVLYFFPSLSVFLLYHVIIEHGHIPEFNKPRI